MDQDDEKISMLLGMGFPDVQAITRALRYSNGDMNEAVTYLTEQPLSSYSTVEDLRDVDMTDAPTMGSAPPDYHSSNNKGGNNLEFPTSNLYELESRLFVESWVIPYKREESLGLCLSVATKLAEEGLCETEENCQRFLDRCLPECFHKLLNSSAVRRWSSDIQEGVFNMVDLLIDLVIARLKSGCIPEEMLRNTVSMVFDTETEWNQKNKHRSSEYAGTVTFADCTLHYEGYGWLIDIINIFGNKGGFKLIAQCFEEKELDAGQMAGLIAPVSLVIKYLVKDAISPLLQPAVQKALKYIMSLEDSSLKAKKMKYCYQLLESIRALCVSFWPDEVQRVTTLHLHMVIRMLKTPHFSSRMIALKELGTLITHSEKRNSNGLDCDFIQDWMTEKAVLSLALEGNLDQVQYTDRMKQLVEFMGPKLKEEELTKIWHLCDKASAHVVDNIHRIMIAAATRFNPHQFDHLLKLIRKSWEKGNDRLREKLLSLIGKIGQDSRLSKTAEKMLDTLWELARVQSLPPHLVHLAIEEHLHILNESANREQLRKIFIIRCVEDIKRSPAVYLPLNQLYHLSKSITRGNSSYFKSEKATLSELNKSHEIVKLTTQSLVKCHALAVQSNKDEPPDGDTLIDGKYSHSEYVVAHLDFLLFLLKEGGLYLPWPRCKEIWDTMISNPKASVKDNETCLAWFSQCLQDLESSTQRELYNERLLLMDPSTLSASAFNCFYDYFHAVNLSEHKIVRNCNKFYVDSLDPIGMEYLWHIVLECTDQQLAEEGIRFLLDMSYLTLTTRLKKDPPQLHQRFITECYKKLEKSMMHVTQSVIGSAVSNATKTLTAMAVSDIASLSPSSRRTCLQHIYRILILVERYVSNIEEQYSGPRILLPHAACFLGKPIKITVYDDSSNNQMTLQCHSNENLGSLYSKIAKGASVATEQLVQITFERDVAPENTEDKHLVICCNEQENRLLHQLDLRPNAKATVKINASSGAQLKEVGNTWNELPDVACYAESQDDSSSCSTMSTPRLSLATANDGASAASSCNSEQRLKEEKKLPGVVMAGLGKDVFKMLYKLSLLDDNKILDAIWRVLYLIPTDPSIADKMDTICAGSMSVACNVKKMNSSPANSPSKREKTLDKAKKKETNLELLKDLLQINSTKITPFRLLYNLEVLSSKVMPLSSESSMQNSSQFCEEFLACGGLSLLTALLNRESLPQEMNYEIRQNIYLVVLQLLSYLICEPEQCLETPISSCKNFSYPVKQSAVDVSTQNSKSVFTSNNSVSYVAASKYLQNLTCDEWLEMINSITRVAWASAAGKLYLCSTGLNCMDQTVPSPESFKTSRENSTGSGHSSGSDSEKSFQGGICMQKFDLSSADSLIAMQALPLLVTVLSLRTSSLDKWYSLPNVKEFIIELLIGCSSSDVRDKACQQFLRLTKIQVNFVPSPSQFLTQVLYKARLPLWVSSTSARGATLKFITQCSQFFNLRSQLFSELNKNTQESMGINVLQMIEDEINWLTNFSTTREASRERPESGITSLRNAENILVAGHLSLISALLSCEGIGQERCGEILIPLLLNDYLFPASKLVLECSPGSDLHDASRNCSAKCTGKEARLSAYFLLVKLAVTSDQNYKTLVERLIALHHRLDQDLVKEFERSPVVEGRCSSGYVGLKNGGATCYMNSVLQQLFLVPGIQEDILAVNSDDENEESLFFQLQSVFGHLLESQLQYFTPEKFWKCFHMGGQPVNIREQQDAFEFYSRLSEQVDDFLKSQNKEKVFSRRFEGVYSIQRICQDCPHRYEREELFLALNLTVTKCNDLHDSLDQFVKGELLEGENAYYCEKCNKKRTAVIRTCIKTLPPILVIQLKRFGYDWEASRALKFDDYFKFPWVVDMGEYTSEALSGRDILPSPGKEKEASEPLKMDPPHSPSSFSQSMKKSPLKLSIPSSSKFITPRKTTKNRYELVGVVVHSGQANAGHYYSYIKDRRGDPISNPNKSKWFKFNDTTVEYVEMNDHMLDQECFGGTYKAKVSYDSSNPMPEDRLRYWNGYLLFYESIDEFTATPKTPKTPRVGRTSRSLRASSSSVRKNLSLSVSENKKDCVSGIDNILSSPLAKNDRSTIRATQTSLCELSELLQEGEKKGMFRQHMPPRILSIIIHNNLTFLRDRDLYSDDYYSFIYNICASALDTLQKSNPASSEMCIEALSLGIRFLLNTYFRTRGKESSTVTSWLNMLSSLFHSEPKTSAWAVKYFTSSEGELHIQPLLLECPDKMVRSQFGSLLWQAISSEVKNTNGAKSINKLLQNILSMLATDVPSAVKTSQQFFTLLYNYCSQGPDECRHIHKLDGFSSLISFLLGPPDSPKRRWSPVQAQDFGPLHSTIAALILYCNIENNREGTKSERHKRGKKEEVLLPLPVKEVIYGSQRDQWLREAVFAFREVVGGVPQLTEALKVISANDSSFSFALLTIAMVQYGAAPSNMLKDLSQLLLEILSISDSLHSERVSAVLSGFVGTNGTEILGLLNIIDNNKENDSRRAYQCIKLIVSLSSRSPDARDHLNNTQTNWQWAVEWLKTKMDDHSSSGSAGFNAALASFSNEDSNTKSFQRTTSAQWTLDEATALLSGMESIEMEIDCEQELLEEIKESPEGDTPSSESSNNNI